MMEYIPLENEVCPIPLKSAQDVGIPEWVGSGLRSAYPTQVSKPKRVL
jgi:hypothetical protein